MKRVTICGESGDVCGDTVTSWKERLPEILRGYDKRDVFNLDETGCFWRALPDRGFGQKGKQCKGGKRSKCRFTIAFLVNADGEKETPIVIWTSATPRCFRGFDVSRLPVKYYHQKNAWMSGEILVSYLTTFNQKMRSQRRSVLLLLDNAGCHPPDQLQEKFSNIKIVFLPANTTSKLQPLDLGVISNFKLHYRKLLLQYVLAKIDTATIATEVTKSINVLTAIRWVALAWREVKSTTIQKCFRHAGVLTTDLLINALDEEDPFQDIDEDVGISSLISRTMGTLHQCSVEEYVNGDNSLSVCVDMDDDQWDENFLDSLTEEEEPVTGDEEEEEFNVPPPVPKIHSFKEAIQSLDDIKVFLEDRGCFEQASTATSLLAQMASSHSSTLTQLSLEHYFEPAQ